ncbi:hypothetical protein JL475_10315 [Streptomyces sp. M2CJ-2]|uniref:hypothetical protein n=1 Tax=Streptomyces sp. M2CJ-2 TaxID=2803948 RepID=UPI0019205D5C|nr:hypothetical protein [Streptomyces sp. M2CJ-2]MBL3666377.1 hypothetical protein [Streptomyces sp. M2CJ-2]
MTNRDWYDDSDYESAVERAERMTRIGWRVIAGMAGLLGIVVIAAVVVCLVVVIGMAYVVDAMP